MLQSTTNSQRPRELASASRREMETAIGRQPRTKCELPQELPPELTSRDKEHDPYADIVGTC
jgi:hypothetical protein